MRRLFAVVLAALVALYAAVALRIFLQERWAADVPGAVDPERIVNPEVAIGLAKARFETNRFRDDELALVRRALAGAPSFYEPSFLLATFHAARFSEPARVRAAYEAALARYPANGRLQLAYGTWLLESRSTLTGWRGPEGGLRDPLDDAELHLKSAMALEPELSWAALEALSRHRVPPRRWGALVPPDALAKTHYLDALFRAGQLDAVWESLGDDLLASRDANILRRVAVWGLEGKRPEVALRAASMWQGLVEDGESDSTRFFEPFLYEFRARLALGEEGAAYDALSAARYRVEAKFGAGSAASLEILSLMGEEYSRLGNRVIAESLFQEALSLRPTYVPALLGLARILRDQGSNLEATTRYEEVLRLDPENDQARRELKSLLAKGAR